MMHKGISTLLVGLSLFTSSCASKLHKKMQTSATQTATTLSLNHSHSGGCVLEGTCKSEPIHFLGKDYVITSDTTEQQKK